MNYLGGIVDIYSGDGEWDLTHATGLRCLIHKATEGTTFTDPGLAHAMRCAAMVGALRGAYHFGRSSSSGKEQADRFYDLVRPLGADIRLILDLEGALDAPKTMTTEQARDFLLRIEERDGRSAMLYGGLSKTRERMRAADEATREVFGRAELWLAAYSEPSTKLKAPAPWTRWTLHQYTDGKVSPGDEATYPKRFPGFHGADLSFSIYETPEEFRASWLPPKSA